jgi:hypothetical protein
MTKSPYGDFVNTESTLNTYTVVYGFKSRINTALVE